MPVIWPLDQNFDRIMHSGLFITGFSLGMIKFLFAHWLTLSASKAIDYEPSVTEIFISVTAGGWFIMIVSYWGSGWLMKRASLKRQIKRRLALEKGEPIPRKKVFTRMNVFIVWIKRTIGIYGVTILAPLLLSIPIGSIICAKFYGNRKRTFPLMLIFTGSYSFPMCLWISLQ